MNSKRIIYRNRTRELISQILKASFEEQMLFFGFESKVQLEEKIERINKSLSNPTLDYVIFDLIEKSSNLVIGSCGFHNWFKDHNRAELGYEVFAKFRNQGYMNEALATILKFGFNQMDLNRIEALVSPTNIASIKVVEKKGFIKEGIIRQHYKVGNEYDDSIMYSLLRDDEITTT